MTISKGLAAATMAGYLLAAGGLPAKANPPGSGPTQTQATAMAAEVPYGPLTSEVAAKLPAFLKPADVAGMSPSVEDLSVQKQATALFIRAIAHVKDGGSADSRTKAEYNDGAAAYAQGRYIEAIGDFTPLCR